jgi:hypothetical protein
LIGTAFLFVSSASGLMAQTEVATNAMPHTLPLINAPSQTDRELTGDALPNAATDRFAGASAASGERSSQPSIMPGTLATASHALKPVHKSSFSVEPDYLPSWVTNQPLSYLQYGAAPAVVTLHFGHQ